MKRLRPPKIGRKANQDEIAIARQWVEVYKEAKRSSDGRLCVNPEAHPLDHYWIDSSDPEPLLKLLSDFSQYGTFKDVSEETAARERFFLIARYAFAMQSGEDRAEVITRLENELNFSERTVERHLGRSALEKIRSWIKKNRNDNS